MLRRHTALRWYQLLLHDSCYNLWLQVRNQRNRFVALIATARQAAAEMTDRLQLLSSEQEILAAEVDGKANLLNKVRLAFLQGSLHTLCMIL